MTSISTQINTAWILYSILGENMPDPIDLFKLIISSPLLGGCKKFFSEKKQIELLETINKKYEKSTGEILELIKINNLPNMFQSEECKIIINNIFLHVCAKDHADALKYFIGEPFNIGHDEIIGMFNVFYVVCENSSKNVLKRLAQHPFNIGHDDITNPNIECLDSKYIQNVCINLDSELLQLLIEQPFNIGRYDIDLETVMRRMQYYLGGYVDRRADCIRMIQMLLREPFRMSYEDIKQSFGWHLQMACERNFVELVELLLSEHFEGGCVQIKTNDNCVLRWAFHNKNMHLIKQLIEPPYNLGHADVIAMDNFIFRNACENGSIEIVKLLAQEPFNIGHEDAMARNNYAFRKARENGHDELVKILRKKPFLVGK